jgi:two-component system, OmpR family, phosphate regulon sensor histidine kinase PhoR
VPLLEQALINLIDNAIKYSPAEQAIGLSAGRASGEVVIRVEDHGCGIGPEHLSRIFERFYRVDKARSRKLGGTGLGLAIVKHIAQVHGGRAAVESALGQGSVFSLHLPAEAGENGKCQ